MMIVTCVLDVLIILSLSHVGRADRAGRSDCPSCDGWVKCVDYDEFSGERPATALVFSAAPRQEPLPRPTDLRAHRWRGRMA